jgi:SAM-dependent methyltransferase
MNSLEKFYDQDYHQKVHGNLFENEEYFWARAKIFNQLYFSENESNLKVLDYGCGLGQASVCVRGAHGYDASLEARTFAQKMGLEVYDNPSAIPRGYFDIVICRHVLEHVPNPLEVLSLHLSLLKPGGRLKLILPKENHGAADFRPDEHMHLYSWNFRNINNLLSIVGFEVVANRQLHHWGFSKLLPIYKLFGLKAYGCVTFLVGRLTGTAELSIEAVKK